MNNNTSFIVIGVVFEGLYTSSVDVVILFVVRKATVCALGLVLRLERSSVVGLGDDCIIVSEESGR